MIDVEKNPPWREQFSQNDIVGMFIDMERRWQDADYSQFFKRLTRKLEETHKGHFQNSADPAGNPWPSWYFRRWNTPLDHKTLDVSSRLRKSLLYGYSDHYQDITDRYLVWGSTVPYAGIHQFGASFTLGITLFGRGGEVKPAGTHITIPARPFVGIKASDFEQLIDAVIDQTIEFLKYRGS